MKIITLTNCDFGGSARQMADAVNQYTEHHERVIGYQYNWAHTKLDYCLSDISREKVRSYAIRHKKRQNIQDLINSADIIKFKGDEVPNSLWCGFVIPRNKPVIVAVGGSNFRRHETPVKKVSLAKSPMILYLEKANLRAALTADLNYPEYRGIYTPQAIDSQSKPNLWSHKPGDPFIIAHSPSNRLKKGTDAFFLPAIELLKAKGFNIEVDLIEKVNLDKCIERKQRATLFFDQCVTGYYGNAALEAMQYGIPVISWIISFAYDQSNLWHTREKSPIINVEPDVEKFAAALEAVLDHHILAELSLKTKQFCDNTHSYQAVAQNWNKIYEEVING